MAKIIGNTTAVPNPQPDWNQTDITKADYIKNKPDILSDNNDIGVVLLNDIENNETNINYGFISGQQNKAIIKGYKIANASTDTNTKITTITLDTNNRELGLVENDIISYFKYVEGVGTYKYSATILTVSDKSITISSDSIAATDLSYGTESTDIESGNFIIPNKINSTTGEWLGDTILTSNPEHNSFSVSIFGSRNIANVWSTATGLKTRALGPISHTEGNQTNAFAEGSHAEGYKTNTKGVTSHAEGAYSTTNGGWSHAEGSSTETIGDYSHSEGLSTKSIGEYTHAEGYGVEARGKYSHSEGVANYSIGEGSHAEGSNTEAKGNASHTEGFKTKTYGFGSHAEGATGIATADYSHVEGFGCQTRGQYSHAEGYGTVATGESQHASGKWNIEDTKNKYATIVGGGTANNDRKNICTLDWDGNAWFEGKITTNNNKALTAHSTAIGENNIAGCKGYYWGSIDFDNKQIYLSKTQVQPTNDNHQILTDFGDIGYAVGDELVIVNDAKYELKCKITAISNNIITVNSLPFTTIATVSNRDTDDFTLYVPKKPTLTNQYACRSQIVAYVEGADNIAAGMYSHVEGRQNTASGNYAHVEGRRNIAVYAAHAEGGSTKAIGQTSHAEGSSTTASGDRSHAEGNHTTAEGLTSHAEGETTIAKGIGSHSEGGFTNAEGDYSHAEGYLTQANGNYSHASGLGTVANNDCQFVIGKYNTVDYDEDNTVGYAFVIGNGESDEKRSDLFTINNNGVVRATNQIYGEGSIVSNTTITAKGKVYSEHKEVKTVKNTPINNAEYIAFYNSNTDQNDIYGKKGSTIIGDLRIYKPASDGLPEQGNKALGEYSMVLGDCSEALKDHAISIGYKTRSNADYSIAIGNHAGTTGKSSVAIGRYASTKGAGSIALGDCTVAKTNNFTALGTYNTGDTTNGLLEVGNGSWNNRSNAHTLDWNGNAWYAGDVTTGTDKKKLATEEYVKGELNNLVDTAPETLNTLNELAAALGDDPNFSTTILNMLGNKVDKEEGKGLSTNDLTDTLLSNLSLIKTLNLVENSIDDITEYGLYICKNMPTTTSPIVGLTVPYLIFHCEDTTQPWVDIGGTTSSNTQTIAVQFKIATKIYVRYKIKISSDDSGTWSEFSEIKGFDAIKTYIDNSITTINNKLEETDKTIILSANQPIDQTPGQIWLKVI